MRIVKISELSEEEKKKIKQRQEENAKAREQLRIDANNRFNELLKKKEQGIQSITNTTSNNFKNKNTSLWQNIQNIANNNSIGQQTVQINASKQNSSNFSKVPKTATQQLSENKLNITKPEEVQNAKEISSYDVQIMNKAIQKNKNIEKGGVDAFNEYMDSTLNAIPGGAKQAVSGLANIATTAAALPVKGVQKLAEITGNEDAEESLGNVYNKIVDTGKSIHEEGYRNSNVNSYVKDDFVRTSSQVVNTISQMLTSYGIGSVAGVPSNVVQGISVGGTSAQEVLNENKDNIVQATITGMAKGYASYFFEKVFDANILTKGVKKTSIQNAINKLISNKISSEFGQNVAYKTIGIIGENLEEFLEDNASTLIDKLINNKELPGFEEWLNNTTETVKITTLSTFIMGLLGFGGTNFQEVKKDLEAQKWINEAQKIIEENNLDIKYDTNKLYDNTTTSNSQPESSQNQQTTSTQEAIQTQQENAQKENIEKVNPYRNVAKANKLVKEKNNKIREVEEQIKQSDLATEKSVLQEKISQIESEYNNRIQELYDSTTEYSDSKKENSRNEISESTETILPMPTENLPISTENRLKNAIRDSLTNKTPKGVVTLGNVSKKVSEKINNLLGINVNNRRHTLSKTDIRHMLNEHGNPETEAQKGQIAITEEDILKIPDIIDNYDDIVQGSNNKQGKTIRYIKSFSDNTSYVVEVVPENSGTLNIKTMWKKPTALTNSQTTLDSTSKTTDSSISSTTNNIIPQNTQNMQVKQENMPVSGSNAAKYDRYKKNILKARSEEVNNLIKAKNETLNMIEQQIDEKEQLLNSKKDKTTKAANNLKMQLENLKQKKIRIENEYLSKIDRKFDKVTKDKINFETRNITKQEARKNLKAEISPLTEDLTKYKDKKAGILYNRETAQRNIDDIVQDKELAQAIKETIFNPIQVHQAQKTREINRLFDKINSLNLDKTKKYDYTVQSSAISGEITEAKRHIKIDEATLAQLLIENKITNQTLKDDYNMSNEQIEKINKTANTFTKILDYLYNKMNEEQIKYGYSPIGKLDNYFPHFFENKPDTVLGKIASYFGIDVTKQDLPTEIAGKTDIFKPGKTWNSNTLQRRTNKTDYDALKAMEKYIQGAADIIYTTEDIQKIREYERQIRYQYSDKGIQESVDDILNDSELTQEAKDSAIDGIFKNTENELSNFVTWLNDYGNTLANKKSFADRNMERNIGRNLYSSMSGIEARIASNTIGGNLSVSLTNFAPLFQAVGTTKLNYLLTGMLQTTSNNIKGIIGNKDINFVDNSRFLTNRFGTDTIADKTVTQKISDVASIPMNTIDEFTAESIVRGKYLENIDKGMTEEQALDNADKYASKLMADRSKGALPLIFNAKNPISKLATMFQVEPNNIISNYLKDMPREATNKVELTKQAAKLMVASYAFNTLVMAIRGGNEVLPDPIRWVSYLIKAITGDDDEKEQSGKDLMESVIGSIPFVSNLAGFGLTDLLGIDSDIGRIPISNAMPSITNIVKAFDTEADSEYRKETAMKEFLKPFIYLGLPTGGAQIKKTFEGIATVSAGGSYKTDKEGNRILQFPVENPTAIDYVKAGILGKYSLPLAKEYQNRNFKALSTKQTKTYEESNLPYKEYLDYIEAGLKKTEDKINYLESKEMTTEQKWGIYRNDLFSDTIREEDGGSQLQDAEYITSNGVTREQYIEIYNKAKKNEIDMPTANEYKEMKSNDISLSNYIDYKIKVKDLTEEKRNNKELSEDENLKNTDKIQILLDSSLSDTEISNIYANYIKSEKDTEYGIMKTAGIDIKEYLKYKQQEFTSETTDDGTLSGKTVSKSKQKKVASYLNSMNIGGNQRLLLYAMQGYSITASQKTQLAKYVYGLDLDRETKLKLYDKFSGFTVYKDGKVTWK